MANQREIGLGFIGSRLETYKILESKIGLCRCYERAINTFPQQVRFN